MAEYFAKVAAPGWQSSVEKVGIFDKLEPKFFAENCDYSGITRTY